MAGTAACQVAALPDFNIGVFPPPALHETDQPMAERSCGLAVLSVKLMATFPAGKMTARVANVPNAESRKSISRRGGRLVSSE